MGLIGGAAGGAGIFLLLFIAILVGILLFRRRRRSAYRPSQDQELGASTSSNKHILHGTMGFVESSSLEMHDRGSPAMIPISRPSKRENFFYFYFIIFY